MIFFIVAIIAAIAIIFFCKSSKSSHAFIKEVQNDFKASFPGVISNVEDILFTWKDKVSLFKQPTKIAVLTGGNRGIGLHVLEKLLTCELTVILGVRNPEASKKAVEGFIDESLLKGKIFYEKCDTGDLESVRNFAKKVQQKFHAIHLLINNAGVLMLPYEKTKDGFESQMAINYLGHFLLTHLLMPQLIAGSENNGGKNARIVNVSSCANEAGTLNYEDFNYERYYHTGLAYADSKLAQLMFTRHFQKLSDAEGLKIQMHAAHPGVVDTDIFQHSIWGSLTWLRRLVFKTPERGSRTIVYAAISPALEGLGGSYLSNCRVAGANKLSNDARECEKFFNFTCELLKVNKFGRV